MAINTNSPLVEVRRDVSGRVRKVSHRKQPYKTGEVDPIKSGIAYLKENAEVFSLAEQFSQLKDPIGLNLEVRDVAFRFHSEIVKQGLSLQSYAQTYMGIPIWNAGISLRVSRRDGSILAAVSSATYDTIKLSAPSLKMLKSDAEITPGMLSKRLGLKEAEDMSIFKSDKVAIMKFEKEGILGEVLKGEIADPLAKAISGLTPVKIPNGTYHLVREVLYAFTLPGIGLLNWRCLLQLETGAVLFLEAFTSGVSGKVFDRDPVWQGGSVDVDANNAALNPFVTSVNLPRLTPPVAGIQELRGDSSTGYAFIVDPVDHAGNSILSPPAEDPPSEPTGTNFDYNPRSGAFAAVNAYYNVDRFIALIVDLGIDLADQFPTTQLPLPVDHRALSDGINAQGPGGPGGLSSAGIRLGKISNASPYMGIATAYRVILHEFGHVLLYDHVHGPNFGFAHSFGDSLAAILSDPGSSGSDRFHTFPWTESAGVIVNRRHDRAVSAGWAWHGSFDTGGYRSEQILSTSLFRIYRSLGGDSPWAGQQNYAMRVTVLLMLKAIQRATQSSNPTNAEDFADLMMEADTDALQMPTALGGYDLGAAHKVIRWGFEKQGAYQNTPYGNVEGLPPQVDVYIDDGRNGEYAYQQNFWNSPDIINRNNPDGQHTHQTPFLNSNNYLYVRIRNRGTTPATGIVVKGFHCTPGGGMVWPIDWSPLTTVSINVPGSLAPGGSQWIGPFQWTPTNAGHECLLATVSAIGDAANTDNVSPSPSWFIVPNDNNVAQRNMAPAPGLSGGKGLVDAFDQYQFTVRNPYKDPIKVELKAELPAFLENTGWRLEFDIQSPFELKDFDRDGKLVKMRLVKGDEFSKEHVKVAQDRNIHVYMVSDEGIFGGMTYQIDPLLGEYKEK